MKMTTASIIMLMTAMVFMLKCGEDKYDDHFDNDDRLRMQKMWRMEKSGSRKRWKGSGQEEGSAVAAGRKECNVISCCYNALPQKMASRKLNLITEL